MLAFCLLVWWFLAELVTSFVAWLAG